ncbi:glycoside hydrolase family 65 protein, partial [Listeria booriae]|nr:glycoside hydrolase family 65 protein [Listeria booriae]
ILDMEKGTLSRHFTVVKNNKSFRVSAERFLSVETKELAVIRYQVEALSDATVELTSYLDGNVQNEDANYEEMFWQEVEQFSDMNKSSLVTKTIPNNFDTPRFTVSAVVENRTNATNETNQTKSLYAENKYHFGLKANEVAQIEKRVVITTSRDFSEVEVLGAGHAILNKLASSSYEELLAAQVAGWRERWDKADVEIAGDDSAQQGIRFNIFQLFATYFGEDARLNIGPKGFTGEKYGGATYWDTEAFALPMYLSLTDKS